jgi:hypothetical protein
MLNSAETVEAEAKRLLIAQQIRKRGRPQREQSQLLQRALALCEPSLPARLFELLCALTRKRPANLDEPQLNKKQRKILELDVNSRKLLSAKLVAERVGVSRQYVHRQRVKYYSYRISKKLMKRLDAKDLELPKQEPPLDISYLIQEIDRLGGTFPVKSLIDQQLYPDAASYARHLHEHKATFSFGEKPLALQPDCWPEPTGPDAARYYRIFDGKPPIIQPRFYKDKAGERVAIIIPGDVVSILIKNVDDNSRERWPREYAEFKAEPAGRPLYEGWPVHACAMVEELMPTGIL